MFFNLILSVLFCKLIQKCKDLVSYMQAVIYIYILKKKFYVESNPMSEIFGPRNE